MTDYTKLVKALRCCAENFGCPIECPRYSPADEGVRACVSRLEKDAAAAIEALQAEQKKTVTQIFGEEQMAWEGRCKDLMYQIADLQAQLPKRGKWIRHPEVKNIYGGECIECPFCGEKYVVQYIADEKFCRNCGADMRAKMEVQDGKRCD